MKPEWGIAVVLAVLAHIIYDWLTSRRSKPDNPGRPDRLNYSMVTEHLLDIKESCTKQEIYLQQIVDELKLQRGGRG